ncbi:recombinase family protein [Mesorhizobium sp.]|uniref:recombinase family protein n=1 Tax=Mesorhizobium sp. TaxID=1871066 RepID=UPI0025F8FAA5|nr:recombinase family protein [Mesorhizobium sp.]
MAQRVVHRRRTRCRRRPFMLHLYTALAEKEHRQISERIRAELAARKQRGEKLGIHEMPAMRLRPVTWPR